MKETNSEKIAYTIQKKNYDPIITIILYIGQFYSLSTPNEATATRNSRKQSDHLNPHRSYTKGNDNQRITE